MYLLKKDSITSRFYSFIWDKDVTDFKTMCPYFWSYFATIVFLPLLLTGKLLAHLASKRFKKLGVKVIESKSLEVVITAFESRFAYYVGIVLKWVAICLLFIIFIFSIYLIANDIYKQPLIFVGFILTISLISLMFYILFNTNLLKYIAMPFKFAGGIIYSLYKQACPLIKWN